MHRVLALLLLSLFPLPVFAQSATAVDVELFLAVDVSRSMSPRELEIQRRGYAEALVSPQVLRAIRQGIHGKIALTYVEWAGTTSQRTIVPWTIIETGEQARAVSEALTAKFNTALRRTSISGVIRHAASSFAANQYQGLRRVIDISGDGPNNEGETVTIARDAALADGIIINGLPLMTKDGLGGRFHLDDLDEYYRRCVTSGPASFVIPVREWGEFSEAVRRKLVLELADIAPVHKASCHDGSADNETSYDCLIGEKLWRRMRELYFLEP